MIVFFCILPFTSSRAGPKEAKDRRIRLGIKLFPFILLAEKDVKSKTNEAGKLPILLVHKDDEEKAREYERAIEKESIGNMKAEVQIMNCLEKEFSASDPLAGIFLIDSLLEDKFKEIMDFGIRRQVIVFSPMIGDVERGATAGIHIRRNVRPSLNLTTIKKSRIRIHKKFRDISRQYE